MKNITIKKGTFREEVYNEYHEAKEEGREGIRISEKSGNVPDIFIWNKEELKHYISLCCDEDETNNNEFEITFKNPGIECE